MKIDDLFKNVWDWLKNTAGPEEKKLFRPIYLHMLKQEKLIEKFNDDKVVRDSPSMFPAPTKQQQIDMTTALNMKRLREDPKQYFPLAVRLKNLIDSDKLGGEEWQTTCKWNKLTDEQAIKLAKGE
jgi:hypothetical protein